jgi:hypothetical protein
VEATAAAAMANFIEAHEDIALLGGLAAVVPKFAFPPDSADPGVGAAAVVPAGVTSLGAAPGAVPGAATASGEALGPPFANMSTPPGAA